MELSGLGRIRVVLALVFVSCGQQELEFDKKKWDTKDGVFYAYREKMITDLMKNHLKKGMIHEEVVELLGNSEFEQGNLTNTLAYEISVDYGWDIDPQQGKTLYIEFAKDSTVKGFRVDEWKH